MKTTVGGWFNLEAWATLISAAIALAALALSLANWREQSRARKLRNSDVLVWTQSAIDQLQTLELTLMVTPPDMQARLTEVMFATSCLIERGRLFFRNEISDDFGNEKPMAYRGYRPIILDQLVIAHQIACRAHEADPEQRRRFCKLANDALRNFVSLAQEEVGRSRTAATINQAGGSGIDVERMAAALKQASLPAATRKSL